MKIELDKAKLKQVDWSNPTQAIASQLGISYGSAFNLRKRLGKPSNPMGTPSKIDPKKLAKTDWTKPNRMVGEFLGCTQLTIWRLRKKLGIKPLPIGNRYF